MATRQNESLVVRQFEDQIKDYTEDALVEYSFVPPFLWSWFKTHKQAEYSIGEFGGGGGNLLSYIKQHTKQRVHLTNVEIVKAYRKYQTDASITFVHGSVLDGKIDDNTFDVVIVRNVLHHLITDTLSKTRNNQMDAIRELLRMTKPGGLVIIEEQVNNNQLSCWIFYYASMLATKLGIRIDRLQITPNTIVGYMTRGTLQWMCERHADRKRWKKDTFERWNLPWYWQMTGLMTDTGEACIVLQK